MNTLLAIENILQSIGGILLAVVILLAMVTIHEFGHYVAGKILGFKINEFSVGFGPALWKRRSKKTGELFAVRVIPLGGYCAFDGEDEGEASEETSENSSEEALEESSKLTGDSKAQQSGEPFGEFDEKVQEKVAQAEGVAESVSQNSQEIKAQGNGAESGEKCENFVPAPAQEDEYPEPQGIKFNDQAPWKRIIVLIAGATMNYLLALFLIITMFACIGQPLYKVAEPREDRTMSEVYEVGDIIESVNGKMVYLITDYMDAIEGKKQGDVVEVCVIRNGERQTISVTLQEDADFANMSDTGTLLGALGLDGLYTVTVRNGFFETIGRSFGYSWKIGGTVLRSLGELLTGKLGMDAVGGPVTTITVTAQAASSGLLQFLNIAALIGVNLAVFNLLPVPALDGSKVVFCIIEWIRKKPINRNVEAMIHFIGIIALFAFAILVDLLHLF